MKRFIALLLAAGTYVHAHAEKELFSLEGLSDREVRLSEAGAFNSQQSLKTIDTANNSSNWCTRNPDSFACTDVGPENTWLGSGPAESPFCPTDLNARFDNCFGQHMGEGWSYTGLWADNTPDLAGIFEYSDGDKYIGQIRNGQRQGTGTYVSADDSIYFGDFAEGVASIGGLQLFAEGNIYIGGYNDDKFHGSGVYVFADGGTVVGEFKADNIWKGTQYSRDGKVLGAYIEGKWCEECRGGETNPERIRTFALADGVYTGTVRNGEPHGVGIFRKSDCGTYVGQWENGALDGEGVFVFCDEAIFFGRFEGNLPNGYGILWSSPGETYFGEWKDNERHGEGIATYEDGDRYVGQFNEGIIDGEGLYESSTGKFFIGVSKEGQPWNVAIYSDTGEILGTIVDGEYCNQCKPDQPTKIRSKENRRIAGTGTGFIIGENHIVTAEHVINDCGSVAVWQGHTELETVVLAKDAPTDLAILKTNKPIKPAARLRMSPPIEMGEMAVNFGFPLYGTLSAGAIVTSGIINALTGFEDDPNQFQYDAATQFGNSGGPVLDRYGNVIGVVSAKLDDSKAQLVNFAVNPAMLENLLKSSNVRWSSASTDEILDIPEIAQQASEFTVLVGCFE